MWVWVFMITNAKKKLVKFWAKDSIDYKQRSTI